MADETKRSPELAPEYALHRVKASGDAIDGASPITEKKWGMNMHSHRFGNLQVVCPGTTGNPAIEILFWSEAAGKFVSQHTALAFAQKGAGVSWEASFDAQGRIVFAKITGAVGDGVKVYIGGYSVAKQ